MAKNNQGFTDEERAAMQDRAKELKAQAEKADGEAMVREKIREMPDADRRLAEKLHTIMKENAPSLTPKTWYGMPAYAKKDGKVVCFFQSAHKFKARYATLGFSDQAKLDIGEMWPTSYALKTISATEEAEIVRLVKKAVG